jgi:hypothetical protein
MLNVQLFSKFVTMILFQISMKLRFYDYYFFVLKDCVTMILFQIGMKLRFYDYYFFVLKDCV